MEKIIIGIIFSSIFLINLFATNYYVSNNGSDDANGLSPETTWATIARVNSQTYNPGDSILFRCGDRWMEYLQITSNGNSDNYLVFSSYGIGEKPKLYGSVAVTSFSTHPSLANVYSCNTSLPVNPHTCGRSGYVSSIFYMINDSVTWGDGRKMYGTSISSLSENFEWYWQNDSVYFYYDGNIADIDTIECPQLSMGIEISKEYITIDGLDLKYYGNRCIGTNNYPEVTKHGLIIRNCDIAYTASKEEGIGYGIAMFHSDMLIENNKIHSNGRRNISLNLVAYTGNCVMRDVIVQNNELYDGFHTTGVDIALHGSEQQIKNITIRNNHIYDYYNVNKGYTSEGISLISDADREDIDSIYIYNNLIQNITLDAVYLQNIQSVMIVNNTFTGPGWSSGARAFIYTGTAVNITNLNNIFFNFSTARIPAIKGSFEYLTVMDSSDFNIYFTSNNLNASMIWKSMYDQAHWYYNFGLEPIRALGFETQSPDVPADPFFIDSLNNLRLQKNSPAIGAGCPVSFVTTDYDGNPREPVNPSIGAYEYIEVTGVKNKMSNPDGFYLGQNYPNPFNPTTSIKYRVPRAYPAGRHGGRQVKLSVYNLLGQELATLVNVQQAPGNYEVKFNASGLCSGVYFYRLKVNGFVQTKKLVLLR